MGCSWRPAALLALGLLLPAAIAAAPIRGVDPALAPRYQPSADGKFACLDGKKTIPFSQVNDDYCDCLDGSDEPGTSACPNGRFYCANKFFLPLLLNASMVDDGVCDCCDGSDEPAGRCPDNCYDKGMESLADLQAQVRAAEAGVAARNKYMADAVGIKAKWGERKKEVDAELEVQRAEKDKAKAEKSKLEEQQKALRDQKAGLEEKKGKLEQPQQGSDAAAAAGEQAGDGAAADAGAADAGADGAADGAAAGETEEEAAAREAAEAEAAAAAADAEAEAEARAAQDAVDAAAAEAAAEAAAAEADATAAAGEAAGGAAKSEEELAKERMAQWIPGAKDQKEGGEAAAAAEEQPAAEDADQSFREAGEPGADDAASGGDAGAGGQPSAAGEEGWAEPAEGGDAAGAGGDAAAADAGAEEQPPTTAFGKARLLVNKLWQALLHPRAAVASGEVAKLEAEIAALDAKIAALDKKLEPVRSRENAARDKVRDLEKEQRDLSTKLEGSYGEQDVFVPLADKCFKAQVDKYTYEVCPYGKASQKEGHSSTSLGTWSGLEENGTRMAFKNGQGCWQGPARSISVTLLCGKREHLAHVAEPSRCEYTADLETPAACTPDTAAALQAELRKRQRLLGGDTGEGEEEAAAGGAAAQGGPRDEL